MGSRSSANRCPSLEIPPPSDAIIKEKEFIEATSRICSFNVMSRPGISISPIEIRLTKDRLSLISRVLSSTPDAYKHTQVLLELADKLGFRGDPAAEATVLAMVADSALQAEDFTRAYETSERMVAAVLALRAAPGGTTDPRAQAAAEVCWVACFQLGRQPEFADAEKKMALLGRALELCPADRLPDILAAWRRLEAEQAARRRERTGERRARRRGARAPRARTLASALGTPLSASSAAASIASRLQGFQATVHMPSLPGSPLVHAPEAAALASKTLSRVAANFPFGRRDRSVDSARTNSPDPSRPRPDVPGQASRALQKGIGWLIGAEE